MLRSPRAPRSLPFFLSTVCLQLLLLTGASADKEPFSFIDLDGCPTQLLRYASDDGNVSDLEAAVSAGRSANDKTVIFLVPGNPGPIGFYAEFMKEIYAGNEDSIEVWGISHAGHVDVPKELQKPYEKMKPWFTAEGEVDQKMRFLEKYVPKETPLVLIGHSVGSYMALQITDRLKNHNILHTYLLFPAIEQLSRGENAATLGALATYLRQPFMALVYSYNLMPTPALKKAFRVIVRMHYGNYTESLIENLHSLASPSSIRAILDTTQDILKKVDRRDDEAIARNLNRLTFYYGLNDHWAPLSYPMELRKIFPHADIRFCVEGFRHAFVVDAGRQMGRIVKGWMIGQKIIVPPKLTPGEMVLIVENATSTETTKDSAVIPNVGLVELAEEMEQNQPMKNTSTPASPGFFQSISHWFGFGDDPNYSITL